MNSIKLLSLGLAVSVVSLVSFFSANAGAINVFEGCSGNSDSEICRSTGDDASKIIKSVIELLLYAVGVTAVVMIVIGGIRYVISQGDESKIKSAKNTILYAVIGLIVALVAYAIVNFVIEAID